MKARRSLLLLLAFVLAVVGAGGLWVWRAKRQYALNRQLIDALVSHDTRQALALVNTGADPNTRENATPALSLSQLFRQLLHHSPPIVNDSPTALHLACGDDEDHVRRVSFTIVAYPDEVPLVQAMLTHGADIYATDTNKYTALLYASEYHHWRSAQLLLDHGANINAPDSYGMTPLMVAAQDRNIAIIRVLLEHGANVTLANSAGYTALHFAIISNADSNIIGMLIAHGADPNARNENGDTPLRFAQQLNRPDLVRLMRGTR